MANKFARSNGDFNNPSIWSLLAGSMSATTVPTIGDNAIANTYTIQITGSVACDNITNGTTYGGTNGGVFNLNMNSSLSGNVISGSVAGTSPCAILSGNNISTIYGNLLGGGGSSQIVLANTSSGSLTVYGTINANGGSNSISSLSATGSGTTSVFGNLIGFSNMAVENAGSGNVIITGNITSSGINRAVGNTSTGTMAFYGNLNGGTGTANSFGILNSSTGSVTVVGNLNGSLAPAISNTSTGSVTVQGNMIADSRGGAAIVSSNAAANVRVSGNIINAPNGIPAVYAASYTVNPVPYQTYIRYANNGTGVGSDAYLYHYTVDSLSAFSLPPVSSVRAGLQYANNSLTGTCEIPATSAVTFGAPVDNTTGTAILTGGNLFDVAIASLTATDSLGAKLKNSATVESVGRIIASFSN